MELLVNAPWPGNVRQLRNLIETMVVLAHGARFARRDIPPDMLRGGRESAPGAGPDAGTRDVPGQELEFILRSLVELKLQVEELRRRLDRTPQRVQVIDLTDHATVADVLPNGERDGDGSVVYRTGMTMADVEKAAIDGGT